MVTKWKNPTSESSSTQSTLVNSLEMSNTFGVNAIVYTYSNNFLFDRDRFSGMEFLIDTGATVSIYPRSYVPRRIKPYRDFNFNLQAANGAVIRTYGNTTMQLDLGLEQIFEWQFTIADTPVPIIGSDFIVDYGIIIDLRNRKLFINPADLICIV
ncbi:uncharacterized protein LOC130675930 [Microplitis mediator]|uniref:uncharacterized protein LOC130675930 n=1 Tax=Microplitis mediator TaxID=375433 RepID=UPI0025522013|nr:uncharacterized protein LOC130675930 [Microplitis mediator]XP_057337820.1 uncharacterized protein LOC130675930 [Microplitis mediator]XP_057337821.1 uncharacterized protein LOC130675930 [Microplitis mediator]XP_057337822.1 uncharacterized protein LOC130675930 [Microplitis mediator]